MSDVDVKLLLIDTLKAEFKDYPIFLQGSMARDEVYPESFFTYFNNSSDDDGFYSNDNSRVIWDFDLNFYGTDPTLVNSVLLTAKEALKAVGFVPDGSGHDVMSDEPSHTGRGMNLLYMQRKEYF